MISKNLITILLPARVFPDPFHFSRSLLASLSFIGHEVRRAPVSSEQNCHRKQTPAFARDPAKTQPVALCIKFRKILINRKSKVNETIGRNHQKSPCQASLTIHALSGSWAAPPLHPHPTPSPPSPQQRKSVYWMRTGCCCC